MKKLAAILLALTLVGALVFAFAPAAGASEGIEASGTWRWVGTGAEVKELPNGGVHFTHATENGTWDGTFSGTSLDTGRAEISPGPVLNGVLLIEFEGTVNGIPGTMLMRVTFHGDPMAAPMWGRWAIVKGADGLEGVSGSGTWYSDFVDAGMQDYAAEYTGTIRMR